MKLDLKLKMNILGFYKQKHENQYKCSLNFRNEMIFLHIKYAIKYFFIRKITDTSSTKNKQMFQ